MKKIVILMILVNLICYTNNLFAQNSTIIIPESVPKPGTYKKNTNLNKFEGTWQWQSGDTIFTIVLHKYIHKSNQKSGYFKGSSWDAIIGWHEYKIGDTVIESSLAHIGEPRDSYTFSIVGGAFTDIDKLTIITFKDLSKSKSGKASLELLPGEKDLARWTLKGTPGVKVLLPGEELDYTFTVPTDVVMRRIKKKNK